MHSKILMYLDEVARHKSIRKAAVALNVSSTTITRKILQTEDEMGVRLFDRHTEGVELTAVGRILIEHCRRTLYDYQSVEKVIEDIRDMRSGHMTIYAIDAFVSRILPQAIIAFAAQYPGISFTVIAAERSEIAAAVQDGRADIGVTLACHDLPPGVRVMSEKLAPIGAIMRPDHPLAEKTNLRVEDLVGFPLLRSLDADSRSSILDTATDGQQITTKLLANNLNLAKALIAQNQGIGIYTRVGFLDEIARGEMHFAQIASPSLMRNTIGWIVSGSVGIGPAKHMFASCLDRVIRPLNLAG